MARRAFLKQCQRCHRWRLTRFKKFCPPCHVKQRNKNFCPICGSPERNGMCSACRRLASLSCGFDEPRQLHPPDWPERIERLTERAAAGVSLFG